MKHKASELTDAAVSIAAGEPGYEHYDDSTWFYGGDSYSTEWEHGGPIIDRHWRDITAKLFEWFSTKWRDSIDGMPGATLQWFMRAFVTNELGEEVELP